MIAEVQAIFAVAVVVVLMIDPLGNAVIFNSLLTRFSTARRVRAICREHLIAYALMLFFVFLGGGVMHFLGLQAAALRVAGGIVLFLVSINMVFPSAGTTVQTPVDDDPLIVPMAMPLIVGPALIAMLLIFGTQYTVFIAWAGVTLGWLFSLLVGAVSPLLLARVGTRLTRAAERFMGMLLVMIAVQMLLDGIYTVFILCPNSADPLHCFTN